MPTKNTQFSRSGHLENMWRRNNTSCSRWELWRCDSPAAKTSQPWTFICSPGLANKDLMLWWSGIFKKSSRHENISWSQWKNVLFHVETQSCRRQWWSKHFDFDDPNTQALAHLPGHPVWPIRRQSWPLDPINPVGTQQSNPVFNFIYNLLYSPRRFRIYGISYSPNRCKKPNTCPNHSDCHTSPSKPKF